jgi:hypothetical protein
MSAHTTTVHSHSQASRRLQTNNSNHYCIAGCCCAAQHRYEPPAASTSNYHSTNQSRPSDWKLWDCVLSIWFDDDANARRPLGKWLYTYYDSHDQQLYHQTVDGFATLVGTSTGFQLSSLTSWLPPSSSYPVHLRTYGDSANFYLTPLDQPLPIPALRSLPRLLLNNMLQRCLLGNNIYLRRSSSWFLLSTCTPLSTPLSPNPTNLSRFSLCRMAPKSPRRCPSVGVLLSLMALALLTVLAWALTPGLHTVLKVMASSLHYDFSTVCSPSFLLLILGQPALRLTIWASSPA